MVVRPRGRKAMISDSFFVALLPLTTSLVQQESTQAPAPDEQLGTLCIASGVLERTVQGV